MNDAQKGFIFLVCIIMCIIICILIASKSHNLVLGTECKVSKKQDVLYFGYVDCGSI